MPADDRYEPSADARQLAKFIRDTFEALLREGMSRADATAIISDTLARIASRGNE